MKNWGLTDEQQQQAIQAAAVRKDAEAAQASAHADRVVSQGIAQQGVDIRQQNVNQSTAAQNAAVNDQFNRAVSDSSAGGSTNLADARRNVASFYQGDPGMNAVRGQVLAKFDALLKPKAAGAGNTDVTQLAGYKPGGAGGAAAPGAPKAAPAAPAPTATAAPTAANRPGAAPPQKFSEAVIRQRATAMKLDPDQAVANARARNILQ